MNVVGFALAVGFAGGWLASTFMWVGWTDELRDFWKRRGLKQK